MCTFSYDVHDTAKNGVFFNKFAKNEYTMQTFNFLELL